MIALTDHQLDMVMTAATPLPPEKRTILLERVAPHLQLRGRRAGRGFGDVDVGLAVSVALRGLVQESAARSCQVFTIWRSDSNLSCSS
jgi:hypothetical protein